MTFSGSPMRTRSRFSKRGGSWSRRLRTEARSRACTQRPPPWVARAGSLTEHRTARRSAPATTTAAAHAKSANRHSHTRRCCADELANRHATEDLQQRLRVEGPAARRLGQPELGATRVALEWTGGSVELPVANDHFLFVSESLYDPPDSNVPTSSSRMTNPAPRSAEHGSSRPRSACAQSKLGRILDWASVPECPLMVLARVCRPPVVEPPSLRPAR